MNTAVRTPSTRTSRKTPFETVLMSGLHAPPVALVHDGPLGDADGGGGRGEAGPQGMSEVRVAVVYGT